MDYVVWVREGGSWRVASHYGSWPEAYLAAKGWRADGVKTRICRRGDKTDLRLRANVMQK